MFKGPLRTQGSVRDIRQGGTIIDKPETVSAPLWLDKDARKIFKVLVAELTAANVPLKQIDSYVIACCARSVSGLARWSEQEQAAETLKDKLECSKQVARYQRDAQKFLELLGASPVSRLRMGIKSAPKEEGALAKLLKAKQEG